jgi:hypothetical protein
MAGIGTVGSNPTQGANLSFFNQLGHSGCDRSVAPRRSSAERRDGIQGDARNVAPFLFTIDVVHLHAGNHASQARTYDNLYRLLGAVHKCGPTTLDGATYTVDNAANRSSKTDLHAAVTSNYTYNALYELTLTLQGVNTTESYSFSSVQGSSQPPRKSYWRSYCLFL